MNNHLRVRRVSDATDFDTQKQILSIYGGVFNIAPIMHQALVGNDMLHMYVAERYENGVPRVVAAAVLKSAEAVMPIGDGIAPIAWALSDVITGAAYRRQGIAMRLLHEITAVVRRVGGRILYLQAEGHNDPAIRLYCKAGFERLRDQDGHAVLAKLIKE